MCVHLYIASGSVHSFLYCWLVKMDSGENTVGIAYELFQVASAIIILHKWINFEVMFSDFFPWLLCNYNAFCIFVLKLWFQFSSYSYLWVSSLVHLQCKRICSTFSFGMLWIQIFKFSHNTLSGLESGFGISLL